MSSAAPGPLEHALTTDSTVEDVLDLVDDEIERSFAGGDTEALGLLARRLDAVATERGGEWGTLAIAASRARALAPLAVSNAVEDESPPSRPPPSQPRIAVDDTEPATAAADVALSYAGWWIRALAYLIDLVVLGVVFGFIDAALGDSDLAGFFYIVLPLAYFAGMHAFANGATVGKLAVRARVRMLAGGPVGLGRATARAVVTTGLWLSAIGGLVDLIVLGVDDRKQSIHDKAVGTIVERVPGRENDA
ncbi:MAG: RDD family protein [Gaiella sp.]